MEKERRKRQREDEADPGEVKLEGSASSSQADDFFKGVKLSLKSVLKRPDINTPKITNAVILCNKIVINVLLFMKLYLLNYYETNNTLPVIKECELCLEKQDFKHIWLMNLEPVVDVPNVK